MRAHTKTRHTNRESSLGEAITAESVIEKIRDGKPLWAVSLAGLRYREDLTQKELAKLLGTSQTAISEMENGKRSVSKKMAHKLAKILRAHYKDFL